MDISKYTEAENLLSKSVLHPEKARDYLMGAEVEYLGFNASLPAMEYDFTKLMQELHFVAVNNQRRIREKLEAMDKEEILNK